MAAPGRESPSPLSVFAALASIAAFMMATLGVVVVVMDDGGGGGGSSSSSADSAPVPVELAEFSISPNPVAVPSGDVTLDVRNVGGQQHNLAVEELGETTPDLGSEGTATLALSDVSEGSYTLICTIAGHREAGMEASLVVGSNAGATDGEVVVNGLGSSHLGHDWELTEAVHSQRIDDYLEAATTTGKGVATEGTGNQILEPTEITEDGFKVFDLEVSIIEWETEPGKVVDAWAYNGQVPGPQIKVDLNDKVRVNVTNKLPGISTDVHWHGISTPFGSDGVATLTQPYIQEGDTFVYEFRAPNRPEQGMYHAHIHGQYAVLNGLFAVFQVGDVVDQYLPRGEVIGGVEIPADAQITQEIPMVLNDAGTIGLSLNAKSFPATTPIIAKPGEGVVVHYYNEGLQSHPMHLHKIDQLVVAKDGVPLDAPYWADTVNVAAGERYSVVMFPQLEDTSTDLDGNILGPGIWAYHCHILTHAENDDGLFGMVTAFVVMPPDA
jgi:plastocyanin